MVAHRLARPPPSPHPQAARSLQLGYRVGCQDVTHCPSTVVDTGLHAPSLPLPVHPLLQDQQAAAERGAALSHPLFL